ncbi:MAG: DedA family protein [Kouleothrix sp.]|nr:DedA family protein [Kouleothrix sp.]
MSLSDLNDLLLTYIVTYGPLMLALVFMLAAMGLPLPSTLCVVAGGAFVQQGVLDSYTTVAVGLAGVVLGDALSYGMGRLLRHPIQRRYGQSAAWLRAEAYFARHAPVAIYLTRCVLTPIAVPINLVAGSSDYPPGRFVVYDAAGELTWLLGYGMLGYLFGSQWEYISDLIGNASGLLVGLLIAGAGGYALIRWQRRPATEPVAPLG